ncbi:MAG: polysaccharide deacetylase family protein [Actinobacteria bacterium]|nr:polysaccharide deacetylase family protein [Actinomycetota bacterium]
MRGQLAAMGVAAAHAGPLLSGIPLLRGCWPGLAGRGALDHVALTFDDGPDDRGTPQVLEVLQTYGVRATFFVLGSMVERHPQVLDALAAAGHEVAVHSWDHRNHLRHSPPQVHRQLARTADLLAERTGARPRYFRPPYGALTGGAMAAARRLRLQPVLWTAWGRDWEEQASGGSVARLVTSQLRAGGTVLLHDSDCTSSPNSWRATVAALPALLDHCTAAGLRVGPVGEHGL